MERADVSAWVARYERLWRTAGADGLGELFAVDISYSASPWEEPTRGLPALAHFWEDQREGPDEQFALRYDVIAVDGQVGVVRAEVEYAHGQSWLDLWIIGFDAQGRCETFEEWPFAPPHSDGHS